MENLEDLTKSFKDAADAAGKLERAQKSLQGVIDKTSGAMGALNTGATTSLAGIKALEEKVSALAKTAGSLGTALSDLNKRLVETAGLSLLGATAIDAYTKAHKSVEQAAAAAAKTEESAAKVRSLGAAAAASQSSEVRKLGKSLVDVFMDLRKGTDPFQVLIDKGPALWEVFSNAQKSSGGFRGLLTAIGGEVAPIFGEVGSLLSGLGPLAQAAAAPLGLAAGAAAVAAGAVAVTAQQIGKTVGENLDHLHLTEEQLARVENKGVTMGDVLSAAWKGIADTLSAVWKGVADALVATFGPALKAVGAFFGDLYQDAVDGVMWLAKASFQVVGGFLGGMRAAFAGLGPAIVDLVFSAVNGAAEGLEKLANMAIGIVNKLMHMGNEVAAKLGIPIKLPELDTVSVGRLENKYAGAAAALGKAMIKGAAQGAADGGRAFDQMGATVIKSVAAARDRRVIRKAGPVSKVANGGPDVGAGVVNDNDVTNNTITNNSNRSSSTQAECACRDAEASARDFTDVRPIEVVQVELLKAQKLEDAVIEAMPQPEALEPFTDALGKTVEHFENLSKLAPEFGKEFEAAFGKSGKAVGDVVKAFADYGAARKKVEQEIKENGEGAEQKRAKIMIEGYGQVAVAAKGLFKEHSAGFAAMEGIERAYHLWKTATTLRDMALDAASTTTGIANSMARGVASAASGAAKIFEQLGPWGFPVVAAMVGVLASLGLHTGAGGGAVPGVDDMKTRQEKQGSGSVLGDDKAKSESLEKALTHAQAYENKDLEYGNAMVRSLRSIDDQIGAVAAALAKSFGAGGMLSTEGLNLGKTGSSASLSNLGFSKSTTRTLQDQGVQFNAASLGDILDGNLSGSTYQQVLETTKKKAFGFTTSNKSKVITETGALDADFLDEVTKLMRLMGKGVTDAAKALEATGIEEALASFKVDLGKLSFKDMTGAQIEEALNAVFGKLGDDMAKAAVPAIAQFQKVGEGAFETLVRVARQYEVIDTTLKSVGMTFKTFGVSSLEARERLVDLVGGLDNLTDQTAFFAENFLSDAERLKPVQDSVAERLAKLKLPTDMTRDGFKKLVLDQDVSTKEGAELYAALMDLAPAFDKVAAAAEAAKDRQASIQDQIDELVMSPAEKLAKAHGKEKAAAEALDKSLVPLLETLWGLQHAAEVDEKRTSIQDQIDDLTLSPAAKLAKSRQTEMAAVVALDDSLVPLLKNLWGLQDAADAAKLATDRSNKYAELLEAQGRTTEATQLRRTLALAAIDDPIQKQYQTQIWAAQDAAEKVSAARDVLTQAYEKEKTVLEETKDRFKAMSEALRTFSASLADTIAGTDLATRYRTTRDKFLSTASLAKTGDYKALERLQADSEAFTSASRDYASTSLDYLRDVGLVRSAVDDAADAADLQKSIAEQQLDKLKESVEGLIKIDNSVISVQQAIANLQAANQAAAGAGVVSVGGMSTSPGGTTQPSTPTQAQKSLANANMAWLLTHGMLGAANDTKPDDATKAYIALGNTYKPGYMDIVNTQGIAAANALVDAGRLSFTQGGSLNFATGGGFEVGGSGPPDSKLFNLALSPGEAVNVRRRGEDGDQSLVNELRRLREELADLRATSVRIANSNDKMERTLTNVTEGGRAMMTEAAA